MASRNLTVTISMTPIPWWQWAWMVPRNLYKRRDWFARERGAYRVLAMLYLSTRRMTVGRTPF